MDSKYSQNNAIPYRFDVGIRDVEVMSDQLFGHGASAVAELIDPATGATYLVADLTELSVEQLSTLGLHGVHLPQDQVDWVSAAAEYQQSYWCGPLVLLQPDKTPVLGDPIPDEVTVISIPPTPTFGSGSHPTTRLTSELLASVIKARDVIVDIGSGSGVLSVLAALRGAQQVIACDIDEDAVRASRELARTHGVEERVQVHHGSTEVIHTVLGHHRVDVVVANVLLAVHREIHTDVAALLSRGGTLIVSGVLHTQAQELGELYGDFTKTRELFNGDWLGAVLQLTAQP